MKKVIIRKLRRERKRESQSWGTVPLNLGVSGAKKWIKSSKAKRLILSDCLFTRLGDPIAFVFAFDLTSFVTVRFSDIFPRELSLFVT